MPVTQRRDAKTGHGKHSFFSQMFGSSIHAIIVKKNCVWVHEFEI